MRDRSGNPVVSRFFNEKQKIETDSPIRRGETCPYKKPQLFYLKRLRFVFYFDCRATCGDPSFLRDDKK